MESSWYNANNITLSIYLSYLKSWLLVGWFATSISWGKLWQCDYTSLDMNHLWKSYFQIKPKYFISDTRIPKSMKDVAKPQAVLHQTAKQRASRICCSLWTVRSRFRLLSQAISEFSLSACHFNIQSQIPNSKWVHHCPPFATTKRHLINLLDLLFVKKKCIFLPNVICIAPLVNKNLGVL